MKWNVRVSIRLTVDYNDIEADTEEEAKNIAKEKADEGLWLDNVTFDGFSSAIAWPDDKDEEDEEEDEVQ